ncbi:MAG: EscU/YscU/HrcU family type III secretion system export apparatus switch protein [Deltaproteobacteria bacterium]|nr:EscU/YscU/HrcU family type III secretion system export apparatus switch protein [Deltaproteobacteria bacterium]
MSENKPFKPSKKKLEKARKEGKVLKSQIVTQACSVAGTALAGLFLTRACLVKNKMLLEYLLLEGFRYPFESLWLAWGELVKIGVGSLLCGCAVGTIVEILQVGFRFESALLAPKASRFDVSNGFKKIWEGLKGGWLKILNLLVLFFCFFHFLGALLQDAKQMFFLPVEQLVQAYQRWYLAMLLLMAGVLFGLGVLEYLIRRRSFFKELSMSHEELRREHKELEGDPHHKSARRVMHESIMQQDLVARVRRARVIVVEK